MNKADRELFEYCKQLILLADLAASHPGKALKMAISLPEHPAAKELRAAVVCHAAGYRNVKRDFERLGVPWSTFQEGVS